MEQTETNQEDEAVEPIVDLEGECPSLTGRSTLTFQVGHLPTDPTKETLFRISDNSGKGMWCKDWASVSKIDTLLTKNANLSARTFNEVHPGRSINTGGFILAVLKDLEVVQAVEGSRHHVRASGATLAQDIAAKLKAASTPTKASKTKAG